MAKTCYLLIMLFLLLVNTKLVGQVVGSDTLFLGQAEVLGEKVKATDLVLSSKTLGLAWALQPLSEISYKTYGPSGVGSLSYRGLPANQTPMLWNGISISSPLLGQVDINQISISPAWEVGLRGTGSGSSPTGLGSPAVVYVKAKPLLDDSVVTGYAGSVRIGLGTYGKRELETSLSKKWRKWSVGGRGGMVGAENSFLIYRKQGADPLLPKRQTNASTRNLQFEAYAEYETNGYDLQIGFLLNDAVRRLPPPITKYTSQEQLEAVTHGISAQQKVRIVKNLTYTSTLGFVHEGSRYRFENGIDVSPFGTRSYQAYGLFNWLPNGCDWMRSIQFQHSSSMASPLLGAYPKVFNQFHSATLQTDFGLWGWQFSPQVVGYAFQRKASLGTGGHVQRHWIRGVQSHFLSLSTRPLYRGPTLNDLYYPTLGNPALTTEQGQVWELKGEISQKGKRIEWIASLNPFLYTYHFFITWLPRGNVWSPYQRSNAQSSGLTGLLSTTYKLRKGVLQTRGQATYAQGGFGGAVWETQQRPEPFLYAPAWRWVGSWCYTYKVMLAEYSLTYTGRRPIDSEGRVAALTPFMLHSLRLELTELSLSKGKLSVGLQASFVSDRTYAFIANYAAPAYWGQITCTYNVKHEK